MKDHTLYSLSKDSRWLDRAAKVIKDNVYEPSYYSSFDIHGQVATGLALVPIITIHT